LGLSASHKTMRILAPSEREPRKSMRIPGGDDDSVDVNVWVNRRVMTAAKIAAIVNAQTPSQLMEKILTDYLNRSGFLENRD